METTISKWLGALPVRKYNEMRENFIRQTGVTKQTLWFWYSGQREPSEINNIRIAYFAIKNDLPAYMPKNIIPFSELTTDETGQEYIHAKVRVNSKLSEMEERYVVYIK